MSVRLHFTVRTFNHHDLAHLLTLFSIGMKSRATSTDMSLPHNHKILSSCFAEHHCWQQIDLCRFTSLRSRTSTGSRKIGGCGSGFISFGADTARHIDRANCHDRNQCCIPSGKAVLAKQPISLDGYAVLSNNLTQATHVTKVRSGVRKSVSSREMHSADEPQQVYTHCCP